jgi:thiol-disulfide isomerase/thioredoxin
MPAGASAVDPGMTALWVLLGVLGVSTAAGLWWQRRSGSLRTPARVVADDPWTKLGVELGTRATLVQFSSAFCQPCRATRRVLTEVAGLVPGVTYVEIDAETHLDAVRQLGVLRTPTTFVLDKRGNVVRRASGQPRKADVIAAVGLAVDTAPATGGR